MDARARADRALALADNAPRRARREAARALRDALAAGDIEAASRASRAAGLASMELGELARAVEELGASAALADRAGHPLRAAEARRSLTRALVEIGDGRRALREAARAAPHLGGLERARLRMMEALVHERLGHLDLALDGYRDALAPLRRAGDSLSVARVLGNRGYLHLLRGDLAGAERDLGEAERRFAEVGARAAVAKVRHSRALVAGRSGEVPRALRMLDTVDADLAALGLGMDRALALRDRCGLLLSVRLVPEAVAAGTAATELLGGMGARAELAETQILLAECVLASRAPGRAGEVAAEAVRTTRGQGRPGWAAVARLAAVRAAFADGDRSPTLLAAARRARRDLDRAALRLRAGEAALVAGRIALSLGRSRLADAELAIAARGRRLGTAEARRDGWLAEGFRRLASNDVRGSMRALRAGLRAVEEQRLLLGASELRTSAAALGDEMAALGLRLALEGGRVADVLTWAEAWRARGLTFPSLVPPRDRRLARLLSDLRTAVAREREAARAGRSPATALADRAALEREIRRRALGASGQAGRATAAPTLAILSERIGDRALVEFIASDDRLAAVVVSGGRARLRDVGSVSATSGSIEAVRFALRRAALAVGPDSVREAARARAALELDRLSAALVDPLADLLADRALVLVPTGALHGTPWGALPGLAGRPVAVAPSAALWLRSEADRTPRGGPALLAVGPDLPGGAREVARLARIYPDARRLAGSAATTAAVLGGLAGASMAHIAAHGSARSDNPLFSSLRLVDGVLTVYELERLRPAPAILVLPACDAALPAVLPGDEVMGLAAALLGLGTRTVIAPTGLAPDRATTDLMVRLHRGLASGLGPSEALAAAGARLDPTDPAGLATRAAFVCLGADRRPDR